MKTKPYTEQDLLRKDYLTFLRILKECEAAAESEVRRLERGD